MVNFIVTVYKALTVCHAGAVYTALHATAQECLHQPNDDATIITPTLQVRKLRLGEGKLSA